VSRIEEKIRRLKMVDHYCKTHGVVWFKKGKMKGYAHPIKDGEGETIGWCNEDAKEVAKLEPQPSDNVLPEHQGVIDKARREVATSPREQSIEQQVAIKEIGEDWRAGKLKDNDPLVVGYLIWLIDRLNFEEAKGETTQSNKDSQIAHQPQDEGAGPGQDNREALELQPKETERVKGFLKCIMANDNNIKSPRLWLSTEYAIPQDQPLTDKECEALYQTIKTKRKW